MNRYRGGSSIVASRLGFADVYTQLKVENPVPLRTIVNFDLLPFLARSNCAADNTYLPGSVD
jgi:hypothetical protein